MKKVMNKLKEYLKGELSGWKWYEVVWLVVGICVILGLSIYWGDSIPSIIAAVTGVACVILTGQGKRSSFIFGTINVIFYAWISYQARFYGEVMLNVLYYFPMNFVGFAMWSKHMQDDDVEVVKKVMPLKKSLPMYAITALAIGVYGFILSKMGGQLPYIDSMSTVVSVAAQILSVGRYTEQWVLWIVVDIVTVIMWGYNFAHGGETIAALLMWIIYLLNAIFMYIRWRKRAEQ